MRLIPLLLILMSIFWTQELDYQIISNGRRNFPYSINLPFWRIFTVTFSLSGFNHLTDFTTAIITERKQEYTQIIFSTQRI